MISHTPYQTTSTPRNSEHTSQSRARHISREDLNTVKFHSIIHYYNTRPLSFLSHIPKMRRSRQRCHQNIKNTYYLEAQERNPAQTYSSNSLPRPFETPSPYAKPHHYLPHSLLIPPPTPGALAPVQIFYFQLRSLLPPLIRQIRRFGPSEIVVIFYEWVGG